MKTETTTKNEIKKLRKQVKALNKQLASCRRNEARLLRELQQEKDLSSELARLLRAEIARSRALKDRLAREPNPIDLAIDRLHAQAAAMREQALKERDADIRVYGDGEK